MTRREQIENYWGLVDVVLDSLLSQTDYRAYKYLRGELHSEGTVGLIKGIDTYKEGKGARRSSYYSLKIRGFILDYLRKERKHLSPDVDINTMGDIIADESEPYKESDGSLVAKYEPKHKIDNVIYHRILMGGSTCREIGDLFGVSKDNIKKRKRRLIVKLRKQMEGELDG